MVIKSEFGIYRILEHLLKGSQEPLTCVDLFDDPEVKKFAKTTSRVSDFLGHMWRRGLLDRYYASKDSTSYARFAYTWKAEPDEKEQTPLASKPRPEGAKPRLDITEVNGAVVIDFGSITVTIQQK